jgi:hypothetical protein
MWDLWWSKWHWDRFLSEFFRFTVAISFHCGCPYSYIIWGMKNIAVAGRSLETYPHPTDTNLDVNTMKKCYKPFVMHHYIQYAERMGGAIRNTEDGGHQNL